LSHCASRGSHVAAPTSSSVLRLVSTIQRNGKIIVRLSETRTRCRVAVEKKPRGISEPVRGRRCASATRALVAREGGPFAVTLIVDITAPDFDVEQRDDENQSKQKPGNGG